MDGDDGGNVGNVGNENNVGNVSMQDPARIMIETRADGIVPLSLVENVGGGPNIIGNVEDAVEMPEPERPILGDITNQM